MAQTDRSGRRSIGGAVFLIGLGVVFLIFQLRPELDPWPLLHQYWPLILIFLGLGKMWDYFRLRNNPDPSARPRFSGTAIALLLLLVLFAVAAARGKHTSWDNLRHDVKTLDRQGAQTVHANIVMPAGELRLSGGSSRLLDADFRYREAEGIPDVEYSVANGTGELNIRQDNFSHVHMRWGHTRNDWDLRFGKEVPLDLNLNLGAGQGQLHLRDVPLTRLEVNMGVGQVDLDLTGERKRDLQATIHGGIGQATIRLPKEVGVRVHAAGGIGSIDVSGLSRDGDDYVNDAYGKSPVTITLDVQGGIGQITLTLAR
ncbi:MAG TPA: toast rack family protein [Candidatus Acidoferrum sp.]|nr:toast rack family protein [Candidatus Acidoferrum sp.]